MIQRYPRTMGVFTVIGVCIAAWSVGTLIEAQDWSWPKWLSYTILGLIAACWIFSAISNDRRDHG